MHLYCLCCKLVKAALFTRKFTPTIDWYFREKKNLRHPVGTFFLVWEQAGCMMSMMTHDSHELVSISSAISHPESCKVHTFLTFQTELRVKCKILNMKAPIIRDWKAENWNYFFVTYSFWSDYNIITIFPNVQSYLKQKER